VGQGSQQEKREERSGGGSKKKKNSWRHVSKQKKNLVKKKICEGKSGQEGWSEKKNWFPHHGRDFTAAKKKRGGDKKKRREKIGSRLGKEAGGTWEIPPSIV